MHSSLAIGKLHKNKKSRLPKDADASVPPTYWRTTKLIQQENFAGNRRAVGKADGNNKTLTIGISVFFGSLLLLLAFLVVKLCYLKHRRIQTIHHAPTPLAKTLSEHDEEQDNDGSRIGSEKSVAHDQKRSSWLSRLSSGTSERRNATHSGSIHVRGVDMHSAPGILVGFLGSPDWETNMVQKVADHRWRQRRLSTNEISDWKFRHTWHSELGSVSIPDARSRRTSSLRIVPHTSRREGPQMAHVSSFGEIQSARMRRQQSLSAVVEGLGLDGSMASASPYGSNASPIYYSANSRAGTFASPQHSFGNRPSTIREETTPNSGTIPTSSAPRILLDCPSDDSLRSTNARISQPVFHMQANPDDVIETSATYPSANGSGESSAASSLGQLPSFPSPPLSSTHSPRNSFIGTVLVNPVYLKDFVVDMHDNKAMKKAISRVEDLEAMLFDLDDSKDASYRTEWSSRIEHSNLFFRQEAPSRSEAADPVVALPNLSKARTGIIPNDTSDADMSIDFGSALLEANSEAFSERAPFGSIANIEHREHARVRSQIPFSLVLPPKAYLGSLPRVDQLTKAGLLTRRNSVGFGPDQRLSAMHLMPGYQNLTQPLRPSPLRKAISLSTISSRFSGGSTLDRTLLSIEQELASSASVAERAAEAVVSVRSLPNPRNSTETWRLEECIDPLQNSDPTGVSTTEEEFVSEFYSFSSAGTIASLATENGYDHYF